MHSNRNTTLSKISPNYRLTPTARCVRDYKFHLYSFTSWQGRPFCISCGTSPVASLLAVGASKALSLVTPNGEVSHSPNPIDQPYAVWVRTSLSPLDPEQKGRACPFEPSLYPRDQPSAVWMPPLHGDQSFRTLNHDKESLQAPLDPMTKLTPFGLRQGLGDFPLHPAPEP